LFVNRLTPSVIQHLQRNRVTTIRYSELSIRIGGGQELFVSSPSLRFLVRARSRVVRSLPLLIRPILRSPALLRFTSTAYTVILARFFLYLSYLLSLPSSDRPSHIILTDVRDVIFQRDPSELTSVVPGLAVGLEGQPIGRCALNSEWMSTSYGAEVLEAMSAAPVSCAGVTIGTYTAICDYLSAMVEQLLLLPCADWLGPDQAAHNYLLHRGLLAPCLEMQNGSSAILTLGFRSPFLLDDSGLVLNADGSVPTIVHQFDRHPDLERRIRARLNASPDI
jgi:hypothetical protein